MPDEKDKAENGWTMPTPVFRTSEGRSVGAEVDLESDIPTEQANRDLTTEALSAGSHKTLAKPHSRHRDRHHRSFWERNAKGLIVLGIVVLGAIVYFVWLYFGQIQ